MSPSAARVASVALRVALPLLIVAAGVLLFASLSERENVPTEPPARLPPLVETATVEAHHAPYDVATHGLVVRGRVIRISAEVAGRVVEKSEQFRAGRRVAKGELLLAIEPRDYELAQQSLELQRRQVGVDLEDLALQVEQSEALTALAREEAGIRKSELQRVEALAREETASQTELDRARREELAARDGLLKREQQTRLLGVRRERLLQERERLATQLAQARLDLDRTRIVAPADARVVADSTERGAFVARGGELGALEDISYAEVQVNLRLSELHRIWDGHASNGSDPAGDPFAPPAAQATVALDVGGFRYEWRGVLDRYEGTGLDPATRTVPCRIVIDEPFAPRVHGDGPDGAAMPLALVGGMFVDVRIHCSPTSPLLRLPEAALLPGDRAWKVEDGRLQPLLVERLGRAGDDVLVRPAPDLAEGDRVVISPLTAPAPGLAVREPPAP